MMTNVTADKLTDAIFGYIARAERRGEAGEAISFLQKSLREDGWHHLGNLNDFAKLCRELGFTVRDGKNPRGQSRQEVTL